MSQYYFLVSSLPFLSYAGGKAIDPQTFLETAAGHLSAPDYALVRAAAIDAPVEPLLDEGVLAKWQRFERGVRNELVKLRAGAAGTEASAYIRTDPDGKDYTDESAPSNAARAAFGEVSPLSGEHLLGQARWDFLDQLETGHFFDVDLLVIYYLKLQLLARKRLFQREGGEEVFRAATEKIMNDYYQEQGDV